MRRSLQLLQLIPRRSGVFQPCGTDLNEGDSEKGQWARWLTFRCPTIGVERGVHVAHYLKGGTEVVPYAGVSRDEIQGLFVGSTRFCQTIQGEQHIAPMLLGTSVEGIKFDAAVDVLERLSDPPLLIRRAGTEVIDRKSVV